MNWSHDFGYGCLGNSNQIFGCADILMHDIRWFYCGWSEYVWMPLSECLFCLHVCFVPTIQKIILDFGSSYISQL
jgi:hypothetical protein